MQCFMLVFLFIVFHMHYLYTSGVLSPLKSRNKTPMKSIPSTTPGPGTKTPKTPAGKTPGAKATENQANGPNGSRSSKKTKTPGNKTPGRQPDR